MADSQKTQSMREEMARLRAEELTLAATPAMSTRAATGTPAASLVPAATPATQTAAPTATPVVVEDLPAPSASVLGLPATPSVEDAPPPNTPPRLAPSAGNVLPGPKTDKLLSPPPAHRPIPAAPEPVLAPPSQPVVVNLAPDPAPKVAAEDDRFASLKRSYSDRLVSMAAVFRDLPRRLSDDGPLTGLKLCEAGDDELRERTFQIFAEALGASQEQQINELQTKLAAKEAETAALGRQLGTVIRDQRELTDQNGLKLRGAEAELATARARLKELEEFYKFASMREAALTERAETLEHETLHWRQRCAPLRDRCAELEDEVGVLRTTRAAEKEAVELAKRKQIEAEADAVSARAAWHGANEAAREARAQAQRYFDDSEGRWLRQGLSVMLSKVFEVIEMPQEVQQKMYSAKDGEELTVASDAFIAGITERVRYLESALRAKSVSLAAAEKKIEQDADDVAKAKHTAAQAAQHAHHMVVSCMEEAKDNHRLEIEAAIRDSADARKEAEREMENMRQELAVEKEAHLHGVAKAIAKCQRQLEDKETEWANDLRKLTASYKEAKEELGAQADQLRAARKEKADAERALHKGLEEAHEVLEASQAKLSEQSVLAASFAGHASEALKQEMLAIFGAQDMLNQARVQASQRFGPGLNAAENVMGASTANSVLSGGISATRLSHLMKTVTPDTSRHGSPAGARGSPAYRRAQADAALLLAEARATGAASPLVHDGRSSVPLAPAPAYVPATEEAPGSYPGPVTGGVPTTRGQPRRLGESPALGESPVGLIRR